jgi:cytoskeletal protein RodZ
MEPSPAIGPQLTRARVALSLGIENVSQVTRIPARVIVALETDDYGTFPGTAYARSFLAQYCDFLGVDAIPAIDTIQDNPENRPPTR